MNDNEGCGIVGFYAALFLALGIWAGMSLGSQQMKHAAVEHHAAEYRCDPETGETSFVWLTDGEGE